MRILLLSDLHDEEEVLSRVGHLLKKNRFDYIFVAGDFTRHNISYIEDFLRLAPHSYIINGNNEHPQVIEFLKNTKNYIHEKKVELGVYNLIGFGYSPPTPFNTAGEISEDVIYERLSKLPIDNKTILLLHTPPYGCFDETKLGNAGSHSIRKIIEEKKPFIAICGHIHENEGIGLLEKTTVVKIPAANHFKYAIMEIIRGKISASFFNLQ